MARFGDEHGIRSIRASPLYKPYYRAILLCAGKAKKPRGELKDKGVIGRGALFDVLNFSEASRRILGSYALPEISEHSRRHVNASQRRRGVMVVVGTVMGDLGYYPYSKHAWSREPV